MAGFAASFHIPYISLKPPSSFSHGLSLTHGQSIPTVREQYNAGITYVSSRYGGSGGYTRSPQFEDETEEVLDLSSLRSDSVRLIDQQQKMVGIVSKDQALQMADEAELDLVILSPDADPPVVRIMDYSKYRYEQQKKKREQQKRNAASRMDLKELKMGYNIDVHDYYVRLKQARKFLKDGDKVKVIINLKGRENEFRKNAIELLRRFQNDIGEMGIEETRDLRERNMFVVLIPNKASVQKSLDSSDNIEGSQISAGV